jgi:hypothetical protein
LFMGSRISGFCDIQQWINGNRTGPTGPINQIEPGNYQQRRGAKGQAQGVMQDDKFSPIFQRLRAYFAFRGIYGA